MNDSQWDAKLKSFLKKTGDDFKRFGTDVKQEAQKLMTEVQDPARQQKLREGLKDVGVWARKTAEEVATLVETGVKKAEGALVKTADKVNDFVVKPMETAGGKEDAAPPAPAATPPSPPPDMDPVEAPAPKPRAKKTVGKGPAKKKPAAARKAAPKKTIGK
jgi:hypothetical protein